METPLLDFADKDDRAGFRLQRFEVFNWGTFDRHVWLMEPDGHNALLTGDIGSGKSTLVDALTTLLVSPQRITYNQAAGASSRERTLGSYVRGAYKTEKDESQFAAKPVYLRKEGSYSVLLGYFFNGGYQTGVTLAQVLWAKDGQSQPERFYVVGDRPLSITEEFSNFVHMAELRKRLRKDPGLQVLESFSQYSIEFRRRMGIQSEQALDLFYKTVSMKSVGNLTEFVRAHMLEAPPVKARIDEICRDFANLNGLHEAVLKAKDQIHLLRPLIADCDQRKELKEHSGQLRRCREALHAYFSNQLAVLLQERMVRQEAESNKLVDRLNQDKDMLDSLLRRQEELRQSIAANGGGRLEALTQEIGRFEAEKQRRHGRAQEYGQYCQAVGLEAAGDMDAFHANRTRAVSLQKQIDTERGKKQDDKVGIQVALEKTKQAAEEVAQELGSLRRRQSNIPLHTLGMRERLLETLSLSESDLPFVGELLQVRPEASAWEGALERLLHNLGLSLLVPDEFYGRVSRYVDSTHLSGRLVYFRVREEKRLLSEETADLRLLIHKLDIKPGTRFHDWLVQDVARHFNYICCDHLEEFQREAKALTRQGQSKNQGRRHEKDDRSRIDDRSHYVLGWDNKEKIRALEKKQAQSAEDLEKRALELGRLSQQIAALEFSRDKVRDLLGIREFHDIDWRLPARQIADLQEEKKKLLNESDVLRSLQASLSDQQAKVQKAQEAYQKRHNELAVLKDKCKDTQRQWKEALKEMESLPQSGREAIFPLLDKMLKESLGDKILTVENCSKSQTEMREWLQAQLDADDKKEKRLVESISQKMVEFKAKYPMETQELDASVEADDEFQGMLRRLQEEDLPRHEHNFRRLLNEGTINNIVLFQNQLDKERRDILEKIEFINKSLREIEYSAGTYIELVSDPSMDMEVRQFQQDLKTCLGGSLAAEQEALYTERKFLELKKIIDRFNGRPGLSDLDQKWTHKVTDVRNWSDFSVSERWKETGEEKEFYSDSSGKSGGQKEKLAYTILASALAYQFGLEWGVTRSRSFRFVMIDEAFGRGSDESARYGLELFKRLNLQLLIVTPLQKIHVIEDYVRSVHLVHNDGGQRSELRNITIECYREGKARRRQQTLSSFAPGP